MLYLKPLGISMKSFILSSLCCFLILNAGNGMASDNPRAFIIFKASVVDEERPIMNICIFRKRPCTYLDPSKSYSVVKPGRYTLINVDFTDNEMSGRGNLHFDEVIKFRFKKNRVYLIGELQLSERRGGKYKMDFKQDMTMISQACLDMPKSTHSFPFANAKTGKEIEITCSKVLGNDA